MAYENKAYGLRARRSDLAGVTPTMVIDIPVAAAYGTALYAGDPIMLSGGYAVLYTNGSVALGVARGFKWVDADGRPRYTKYLPASTTSAGIIEGYSTAVVSVEISQGGQFDVLASTGMTIGDAGKYAGFTFGTADTLLGQSGVMVLPSTLATAPTTNSAVQIIGAVTEEGNTITDARPKLAVRFIDTPIG